MYGVQGLGFVRVRRVAFSGFRVYGVGFRSLRRLRVWGVGLKIEPSGSSRIGFKISAHG